MGWQYVITFAGSLVVALVAVWFAGWWSAKRDYKTALKNLRSEVLTNIKASSLICQWVDENVKALEDGQMVIASCPHLHDYCWVSTKGALAAKDYSIAVGLEDPYLMIAVIHDLLRTIEELKWGAGSSMTSTKRNREAVFKATKEIASNKLLPLLVDARKVLDNKLKIKY